MKKLTFSLSRTVLLLLLLLFFSAACSSIPHEYVSSYDKIQGAFTAEKNVIFPDLTVFNFIKSSVTYRLTHDTAYHSSPVHEYTVYGDGYLNDTKMHFSLNCLNGIFHCATGQDPITYNGTKIFRTSNEQGTARFEEYHVYINGHEYTVSAMFDEGKLLSGDALNELRAEVDSMLHSFTCRIIDEAQRKV